MEKIDKDFLKKGLTSEQAEKNLEKFGLNEIERKKELSWARLLVDQFKSPLIYILFLAGIVTLLLGEHTDSVVIFLAVLINTLLGFFQEAKAEKSLIALRKLIILKTFVIRDGEEQEIEAKNVAIGDLAILKTGAMVPADGVLVEAVDLFVNEAILTGESEPVRKFVGDGSCPALSPKKTHKGNPSWGTPCACHPSPRKSRVFMGTVVVAGRGKMVVEKIGMETAMGKIAAGLSQTIEEETPLKRQITHLSKILASVLAIICLLILLEGLLHGKGFLEMFTLSVAVAVAAIPESLVISVTVILSLGMQRLLVKKALVRKLLAAETLGSVTVICADKTGTLTEGKLKVVKADFVDEDLGAKAAILCNNMINPLEIALREWARRNFSMLHSAYPAVFRSGNLGGQAKKSPHFAKASRGKQKLEEILQEYPRVDEIPFSSKTKLIVTLHNKLSTINPPPPRLRWAGNQQSTRVLFVSGAPEMILRKCKVQSAKCKVWQKKLDDYTNAGLRVVGFAYKKTRNLKIKEEDLKNLTWLGLVAFEDPVRMEVKRTLKECQRAGIRVKVITGDYKKTALAVLRKLAIGDHKLTEEQVMEGEELERIPFEELKNRVEKVILFCRTNPEQKIKIVEALQENGETVAMIGDGVNDALALKKADIGVVIGEASEVAKETADIVLLDSNFKTLLAAIVQGRAIFENIKKVVLYLLSDSFTEVVLIGGALTLGLPAPLLAGQILWVNLVEDSLPALSLAFEKEEKGLLERPPRKKGQPILDRQMKILIFIIGIVTDIGLLGIFIFLFKARIDLEILRTIIFVGLGIDSLFYIFSCKSLRQNVWQIEIFNNKFLLTSIVFGLMMLLGAIYLPTLQFFLKTVKLPFWTFALLIIYGLLKIGAIEAVKWMFLKKSS